MSEHKVLTFEALESSVVPEEWVPVPEYGAGMEVLVRGLTPEELFLVNKDTERHPNDLSYSNARLMAASVVEPKWKPDQWQRSEKKLAAPYLRILGKVQEMSGITAEAQDEAQKNSLATPA